MRKLKLSAAVGILAIGGCQDLAITNPNAPDRGRATQQPTAVESFVATSFRTWWPVAGHDDYPSWALSTSAREISSSFADFGQLEVSTEPRSAWNNSPVNARAAVNQTPWYGLYRTISSVNDALIAIDSGLVIIDAPRTARTRSVAKFMQGISHGQLGLYYDKAFIVDEKLALDTITQPTFYPYPQVIATSISQLDASIAIAKASSFTLPGDSWLFQAMSSADFARLANSFAARYLAYAPRTRAERAAVNWTEVIRRIDTGITADFAPVGQVDILWDDWKRLIARVRTGPPSDFGRPSYWLLGPADSANGFINWANLPAGNRTAFQIRTKDRRIQGSGGPATPGSYFGYHNSNIGAASRGTFRYSHYYYLRFGRGTSWQEGPLTAMTVTEMDLLKAEALIRLNRPLEAVPLINKTRVANGQLPRYRLPARLMSPAACRASATANAVHYGMPFVTRRSRDGGGRRRDRILRCARLADTSRWKLHSASGAGARAGDASTTRLHVWWPGWRIIGTRSRSRALPRSYSAALRLNNGNSN